MLKRPENIEELQKLMDFVLLRIGDKGKVKVSLNGRLRQFQAWALTSDYVKTGRRKVEISKRFFYKNNFYNCEEDFIVSLINLIIHEISHFKQSKTRKMRKQYLKTGFVEPNTFRKKYHTKSFHILVKKLKDKFYKDLDLGSVEL